MPSDATSKGLDNINRKRELQMNLIIDILKSVSDAQLLNGM